MQSSCWEICSFGNTPHLERLHLLTQFEEAVHVTLLTAPEVVHCKNQQANACENGGKVVQFPHAAVEGVKLKAVLSTMLWHSCFLLFEFVRHLVLLVKGMLSCSSLTLAARARQMVLKTSDGTNSKHGSGQGAATVQN